MVVRDFCAAGELLVEFVAFRACNHEIVVGGIYPFGKRVRHSLWESLGVRSPCEHHLGSLHLLVFLNGDYIGKRLKRVNGGSFHRKHRAAGVFHKLVENAFLVVVLLVFEACKRAHPNHIAVAAHHRDSLQQMLALVAVHNHATLGFEFPCALVHIKHNHIHAQVHSSLLCAQASTQTGVEKHHQERFVFTESLVREAVLLHFKCFFHSGFQVANIIYVLKYFHNKSLV